MQGILARAPAGLCCRDVKLGSASLSEDLAGELQADKWVKRGSGGLSSVCGKEMG